MRTRLSLVLLLAACVVSSLTAEVTRPAVAADQTWTGTISDKMCGADHKKMGGKLSDSECTLACTKGGAPYVLVTDGNVFPLASHESDLRTHAGHTVQLTGELKGDTIRVSKIEMLP